MVLYQQDGRVMKAHENHLEREAKATADTYGYIDQIELFEQMKQRASRADVKIVIEVQKFRTLFSHNKNAWGSDYEWIEAFCCDEATTIEKRVDRDTLIRCSSLARDHFLYNPSSNELRLPVGYPKAHISGQGAMKTAEFNHSFTGQVIQDGKRMTRQVDHQFAFIRPQEIRDYIVPWLERVQKYMQKKKRMEGARGRNKGKGKAGAKDDGSTKRRNTGYKDPRQHLTQKGGSMELKIPNPLLDKIHLYNAMLQLGLPRFVQLPLIDALVLQMYQTRLSACHLDTVEMTIGRFYARGLAILDPVINALIGTYALRSLDDRSDAEPAGPQGARSASPKDANEATQHHGEAHPDDVLRADGTREASAEGDDHVSVDFSKSQRGYLDFAAQPVRRGLFGNDTYVLPPKLPVLGHNISNWSGSRLDGSIAAAHMGLPLNIGLHKKFIRRDAAAAMDPDDYEELQTNRLGRLLDGVAMLPGRGL